MAEAAQADADDEQHGVIAVDLTERMLSVARGFIQSKGIDSVEFLAADAEFLPFAAESFDLVTCRIAAHHFPDIAPFARESARVLRPGGRLLFQDQVLPENEEAGLYVDNFERLRDPSHHGAFHRRAWETFFEDADLSILHEEIVIKRHMFLDWAQRQGCTAETIAELTSLVQDAPIEVRDWLLPEKFDSLEEASFCNRHIILVAVEAIDGDDHRYAEPSDNLMCLARLAKPFSSSGRFSSV